jgi:hypothetical protein
MPGSGIGKLTYVYYENEIMNNHNKIIFYFVLIHLCTPVIATHSKRFSI